MHQMQYEPQGLLGPPPGRMEWMQSKDARKADASPDTKTATTPATDTKAEKDDEMTGAVKPQGLFDITNEDESPDWGEDETAGIAEVEQEDTPTDALEDKLAKSLQTFLGQMQGLVQATMEATQQTLVAMNSAKASGGSSQPTPGKAHVKQDVEIKGSTE